MSQTKRDAGNNQNKSNGEGQVEQLGLVEKAATEAFGAKPDIDEKPSAGKMKIDLHCHSEASADCSTPLSLIPGQCVAKEVTVQAITDHNQIWGALKLQEMVAARADQLQAPLSIIVGEEVSTTEGEIIGLFLNEKIEAGLSPEEAIEAIKAQEGLVLLPHGFDPLKRWRLHEKAREALVSSIDIVETFNARVSRPKWNRAAVTWAKENGILMSAGSDAHTLADIGSAWVEVPHQEIRGPQDLLNALKGGAPVGVWTHPVIAFIYKKWDRFLRRIKG